MVAIGMYSYLLVASISSPLRAVRPQTTAHRYDTSSPPSLVPNSTDVNGADSEPVRAHDPLQELLRPGLARRAEHLLGRSLLEDDAVVEEADACRDIAGEAHLVGRDHHCHSAGGELPDHLQHLRDELRVERARDLVEQHQPWLHGQRADDRDPLLLAAGEVVGIRLQLVREPEAVKQRTRLLLGLVAALAEREPGCERDVLEHAHVREEVEGLEDDPDPAAHPVHVDATPDDLL